MPLLAEVLKVVQHVDDATCFKAVYIVCGYTDLRSSMVKENYCGKFEIKLQRHYDKTHRCERAGNVIKCAQIKNFI